MTCKVRRGWWCRGPYVITHDVKLQPLQQAVQHGGKYSVRSAPVPLIRCKVQICIDKEELLQG
jgi:hypothetical protein